MIAPRFEYIMIHHSASPDHHNAMSWDDVKRIHVVENGWADLGYHAVAERVDGVPIVIFGRGIHRPGAHCAKMNTRALGLCIIGNYEVESVDVELVNEAIKRFILPMSVMFNIPSKKIVGHRDFRATLCPGKNLYAYIPEIRKTVDNHFLTRSI